MEVGTWITVPTNIISQQEWMNLHEEENFKRDFYIQYQAGEEPIFMRFQMKEERIDTLKRWLIEMNHEQLYEPLREYGVTSLAHFEFFDKGHF